MKKLIIALLVIIPTLVSTAQAQEIVVYPSAAYIATAQPEYFQGRAHYWYNNRWYYRDGARWSYYRSEPVYLRDRRAHWGDQRVIVRGNYRGNVRVNERYHYRR